MTILRNIALAFLFTAMGCKDADKKESDTAPVMTDPVQTTTVAKPDTVNQDIYDFMKIVIADQKLDSSYGLTIEPEPGSDLSQNDKVFLKTLLIEKPKQEEKADTSNWNKVDTGIWIPMPVPVTFHPFELEKCLTRNDINYMLSQKEALSTFKWDNTRLHFNLANNKNWYCFSIPLFSKDRNKAVMMIRSLCPGLCGTGYTVLFIKEKNKWTSQTGPQWIH